MMIKSNHNRIISSVQAIMTGEADEKKNRCLKTMLIWLSRLYGIGVRIRVAAYRTGLLRAKRLPCCVVSIGNITVGGTGKTPMALYVSRLILKLGYSVALVSRGYKGNFEKTGGIVSNGKEILCTPLEAGDESYMAAKLLKIPVVVGKNRFNAGMAALKQFSPDVIVLDDGFQHLGLQRDLDLLLLDAKKPLGNGYLLPRGVLREVEGAAHRSHALIFTRSDRLLPSDHRSLNLKVLKPDVPVFKTVHIPVLLDPMQEGDPGSMEQPVSKLLETVKGKQGFLFSGIADNGEFKRIWENMGLKVAGHLEFPDHYWYEKHDIDLILAAFKRTSGDFLITTEKDYVKIQNRFSQDVPMIVAGVRIRFEPDQEGLFEAFVKNRIDAYFKGKP